MLRAGERGGRRDTEVRQGRTRTGPRGSPPPSSDRWAPGCPMIRVLSRRSNDVSYFTDDRALEIDGLRDGGPGWWLRGSGDAQRSARRGPACCEPRNDRRSSATTSWSPRHGRRRSCSPIDAEHGAGVVAAHRASVGGGDRLPRRARARRARSSRGRGPRPRRSVDRDRRLHPRRQSTRRAASARPRAGRRAAGRVANRARQSRALRAPRRGRRPLSSVTASRTRVSEHRGRRGVRSKASSTWSVSTRATAHSGAVITPIAARSCTGVAATRSSSGVTTANDSNRSA